MSTVAASSTDIEGPLVTLSLVRQEHPGTEELLWGARVVEALQTERARKLQLSPQALRLTHGAYERE